MHHIETIHLLPHTHVDFGYTDLPSTIDRLQVEFTRAALRKIDETRDLPEAARFRWTIEVAEVAELFLGQASQADHRAIDAAFANGQLEVGAAPFHLTGLLGHAEWKALLSRLKPIYERFQPRAFIQNDVNGIPWGVLPSLLDRGIEFVSAGLNEYGGAIPFPRPQAFWWEGPDQRKVFAWLGQHYCEGYFYFHETEWRRGPVPHSSDVFYNPPGADDVWQSDPEALRRAHTVLTARLGREYTAYPHRSVGLQVTNMWRMDNDPPAEQLSKFVAAWNDAELKPALRVSTFSQFLGDLRPNAEKLIETRRGDWADWWADGVASMPIEIVSTRAAAALLDELPQIAAVTDSGIDINTRIAGAWKSVSRFTEHTFGSYNTLAEPSSVLTLGSVGQKSNYAFQAFEDARSILADVIRTSPMYRPMSLDARIAVVNSHAIAQSGWISIPATSLRTEANALISETDGRVYPLLPTPGPIWSKPDVLAARPFDRPDDVWTFSTRELRAFIGPIPASTVEFFRLATVNRRPEDDSAKPSTSFGWSWDGARLCSLTSPSGREWVDPSALHSIGECVVDYYPEFGAREYLLRRDKPRIELGRSRRRVEIERVTTESNPYGAEVRIAGHHEVVGRFEQTWLNHHRDTRVEINTTFWLNETFSPVVLAIAFPFMAVAPEISYESVGVETRVGNDQLHSTCGDYQLVGRRVSLASGPERVVLHTPDVPLISFGELEVRSGRTVSPTPNGHIYSIVASTCWDTNFPHLRSGKLSVRHVLTPSDTTASHGACLHAFPA